MSLPRIGITLGDPGGIGPEIVVKSLLDTSALPPAQLVLFGERSVLEEAERTLGKSLNCLHYDEKEDREKARISLKEVKAPLASVKIGKASGENGRASFLFFEEAVRAARRGELQSVVTAPISKLSWELGGISWRGHTEYLEQFYPEAVMTFWSERLTVALLSHHVPLKEALRKVEKKNLLRFFQTLRRSMEKARPGSSEFLVAGLNPHAGEDGLLGKEESEEIIPAIEEAKSLGLPFSGPYPPDVVFRIALGHPEKIVVALYHDQGLIAFKLEAFETGVNVTLGMPFIRSSPDHGTAFDIAGKGRASQRSMVEAIRLAAELSPRSF
jgi:4-hydroxythreonine-4-phosphate dehydrogenase